MTAERRGHSVADILQQLQQVWGETQAALSALTIVEFAHGIERAQTEVQRQSRQKFLSDLRDAMKVQALTDEFAARAGAISCQLSRRGIIVPFADLLIGVTALHHGCELVTENVRHFELIPDLVLKKL